MSERAAALAYAAFVSRNWEAAAVHIEAARAAGYEPALQLQLYGALVDYRRGRYGEAIAGLEAAFAAAQAGIGEQALSTLIRLHLLQGDAERGWKLLLDCCSWGVFGPQLYSLPRWRGETLAGRHIVVCCPGVGDDILYVRYVPGLAEAGARVSLNCRPRLVPLFRSLAGVEEVLPLDTEVRGADFQVNAAELPALFEAHRPENVWPGAYLHADPRPLEDAATRRVGLVWGADSSHWEAVDRTASLAEMSPLADVPGVRLYGLQFGPHAAQLLPPPAGMAIDDLASGDRHFGDAASAIAAMDLVITIDTSIANLAGAMGIPVWVALPVIADWRFLAAGDRTPWYPTARLYRQETPGDWRAVFRRMARDLVSARPGRIASLP